MYCIIRHRVNPGQDGYMYLRKSKKPNGRTYLTIVQGYRDENGKNRARTVKSLGYVDALEAEFGDPVAHFEEECRRMTAEAARAEAPIAVEFTASKKIDKRAEGRVELGAAVPSAYLHRDLGIWSFFERKRTARGFSYDPCRILELLVWDRIAHPSSKHAAWEARERFPRKCGFTADDVYRCLTYLDGNADALVSSMNASLEESRGPRDASCLYYDVTNYYFECGEEDGFRMRGVSKEHRPSPIVQMGLFLDSDGLPLGYELFPGNRNDMTTLLPAMSKAGVRDLPRGERVVVVADKGLNTSANIAACVLDGNGYIFSQSVRKATMNVDQSGSVIITFDDRKYNLSIADQYRDFLMWITSLDERAIINETEFDIDKCCPSEEVARAERYRKFFVDFLNKRKAILDEASEAGRSRESVERGIRAFTNELRSDR